MDEKPPTQARRKKILVDKTFQLQYLYVWLIVAFGLTGVAAGFYFLTEETVGFASLDTAFARLLIVMGGYVLITSLIMGWLTVSMTHKVAGAAWRLDTELQRLTKGDMEVNFKLRKGDYLQTLATHLVEVKDMLRTHRDLARDLVVQLEAMEARAGGSLGEENRRLLATLRARLLGIAGSEGQPPAGGDDPGRTDQN